ncbi:Cyclic AMP-responsive element-binding protein 3-like protein 1 [Echinococcus granulosus]|nr:Cyclic AMP-responsive element-binding protein 3-like protein 1 [Echinococcus granulosus]
MEALELADIFPGLDDEALGSLGMENAWPADIFSDLTEKDLEDALLTDITSKPTTKSEPVDVDIFGDEVEVNNSSDQFASSSNHTPKGDLFTNQEDFTQTISTDTSPETIRLTPETESNCSTPSNSDSFATSLQLSPSSKKQQPKRSTYGDIVLEEVPAAKKCAYAFSPPIVPHEPNPSAINRVHYVLQKGQTLILQTEKPNSRIPQTVNPQSRIKALNAHPTANQTVFRRDANEFIRIKPLAAHQRQSVVYPVTPDSHASSDTDGSPQSPSDGIEPRGMFIFNARNGASVTSTSAIRLTPATGSVYTTTERYNGPTSYISRQSSGSGYGVDVNSDYTGGYGTGNSSAPYRQQTIFQSSAGILVLTDEEKRTLLAEGYSIPTRLPLSKQEERNLKKIRRKIKNKISAQESRRKKKEYVESLEKRVEAYAQENADLKRRLDGLEGTNRSLLSQLRHLQQAVNKSSFASANSTSSSSSSPPPSSVSQNSGPASSMGSKKSTSPSTALSSSSSSAYLMVFLACFAALFAGQPDASTSTSPGSRSYVPALSSSSKALATSGHIVGDLSTFGSLHQIGYTWTARTQKMGPRLDGDYARGPNVSYMREVTKGTASIYRMHEWARTAAYFKEEQNSQDQEAVRIKSPVSRSRILGSAKDFDECEPMTWWEYFFGQSGAECRDDREATKVIENDPLVRTNRLVNAVNSTVQNQFVLAVVQPKYVPGLANAENPRPAQGYVVFQVTVSYLREFLSVTVSFCPDLPVLACKVSKSLVRYLGHEPSFLLVISILPPCFAFNFSQKVS